MTWMTATGGIHIKLTYGLVKELLTTAENQRHIRFKKQARYKLHKIVTKTEGKGREMRSKQQNHAQ